MDLDIVFDYDWGSRDGVASVSDSDEERGHWVWVPVREDFDMGGGCLGHLFC